MVYLDHAAGSFVYESVKKEYIKCLDNYANPNSVHERGLQNKEIIDAKTKEIANMLGVTSDSIIYTSGATESNNLAIFGVAYRYKNYGKHIIISSIEHTSITAPVTKLQQEGFSVSVLNVVNGHIDINELKSLIRDDTILVSITALDSEVGCIINIDEVSECLKGYEHIFMHVDASQKFGKLKVNLNNFDLVTINPHKFHGLLGIGLLIKSERVFLEPMILGGKSVTVYRSGTPDVAMVSSTCTAIKEALTSMEENTRLVTVLRERLINYLKDNPKVIINSPKDGSPYILNFSVLSTNSEQLVKLLSDREIYVSHKTSCCPVKTPSKIVYAITHNKALSLSSIRVSFSEVTTIEEIDLFYNTLKEIIND